MILPSDVGATVVEEHTPTDQPEGAIKEQGKLSLRVVRTIAELKELNSLWRQWCDDPDADMDYYLMIARQHDDFVRPHVMVVYRDGRPDSMLVGRLEHTRLRLRVGYKVVSRPFARRLFFVQGGYLGNQSLENSRFLVKEILSCLRAGEADVAELTRVRSDADLHRACQEPSFWSRGHKSPVHQHRTVKLPRSFDEFMHGISRKSRHEVRRHERKIEEVFGGKPSIHCYRHENEIDELAREVDRVSRKTYQRALGVGFDNSPETLESLRLAARRGGLRGCVLYLGEQPCAFFVGNHYKHTFHGNFMGFDPEYGQYSPGLMVLMHSIEECFEPEHRATQLDLGWGDRQFKRALCNCCWEDGPLYLYAPNLSGLTLNVLTSGTIVIDRAARKLVTNSSFLQKMKKTWQRWKANKKEGVAAHDSPGEAEEAGSPVGPLANHCD